MPAKVSPTNRAYEISKAIAAIDVSSEHMTEWAPQVIAAFAGDATAWRIYDDTMWRAPNFWAARSVRNHPVWGPRLFESLTPKKETAK